MSLPLELKLRQMSSNTLAKSIMTSNLINSIIVELVPAIFNAGPDECEVMTTIYISTMDQDRM